MRITDYDFTDGQNPNEFEEDYQQLEGMEGESDFDDFDDTISEIDFSDITGDFKKSFSTVNRRIGKKQKLKSNKQITQKGPAKRGSLQPEYHVKKRATISGRSPKQLAKIYVPRDKKVIVEGVSKFILSKAPADDAIKNIGYYKEEKLKELVLIFNNDSASDFTINVFNPSTPFDYFFSTSLNLNDKIQVAGGAVKYSDVLYNLLGNPTMIVNAKFVISGPTATAQRSVPLQIINKAIDGVEVIAPLNLDLQIDNMQVDANMSIFNFAQTLGRPYIPDGMDTFNYTVYAGNTVTMAFFYKQISLKKEFFPEAKNDKQLL